MMDSAVCIECDRPVRARQEGLQCDGCDRWQHRTCNTGISRKIYKATVRGEPEGLQTWYCNNCPRPGMGPATPTLRQKLATPTLRQKLATPTLRQKLATPTLRQGPATHPLRQEPDPPTLTERSALPTLTEGPALPTLTEGPVFPTLTERSALPTLTEGPALPTLTEGPALPTLTKGPALPTLTEGPAFPTLTKGPAFPTLIKKPARSTMREGRASPYEGGTRSPIRRRPIKMESSSSSSSDESDETDVERAPVFRPLFLPLCPNKFRWNPCVPAPDATFIVERKDEGHMSDNQSPRRMDKAFLEKDSEDDSEDDTFWFPNMRSTNLNYDHDDEVRYEIIENGTSSGHRKLVSSDGYSYTVRRSSARTTTWKCSVRNRKVQCSANVIQRGQSFTRGLNDHIHPGIPFLTKRLRVMGKVKTRAMTDRHLSAASIVKAVFREEPYTCGLPQADNLIRIVNRQRSKLSLQH